MQYGSAGGSTSADAAGTGVADADMAGAVGLTFDADGAVDTATLGSFGTDVVGVSATGFGGSFWQATQTSENASGNRGQHVIEM